MRRPGLLGYVIIAVVVVAVLGTAFSAVAKKQGKYIGSAQCTVCHGDTHPAIISSYKKTPHPAAMVDVAKKPDAVVATFDANAPFTKDKIKYVLGTGKRYQDYLDKDLNLLPGQWDAVNKKWMTCDQADAVTQCVGCHVTNFDPDKKSWSELGVGCEACHGPGGAHSESMEAKDIVNPKKLDVKKRNMVCGQCHSQGMDATGKYAYSLNYQPGGDLTADYKLSDTLKGMRNSQYNTFLKSKHGQGGTMGCTLCHSAHGDKAKAEFQLVKPINEQCLACHKMKMGQTAAIKDIKTHAPSAGPNDTCATCHMVEGSHTFEPAAK